MTLTSIYKMIDEFNFWSMAKGSNMTEKILIAQRISLYLQTFYNDYIVSKKEQRHVSLNQKTRYLSAFDARYRSVVGLLLDSIEVIGSDDVFRHIRICLGLLPKDRRYVLYCPVSALHDSLKSVMFFELLFLYEAITLHGLNIIYIYYGAFEERRDIAERQKGELQSIGVFDVIYMDDISYSASQLKMDFIRLFSIGKYHMFVLLYGMLPQALEKMFDTITKIKTKNSLIDPQNLITIMTQRIIVTPFYFLSKMNKKQDPLDVSAIINEVSFKPTKSTPFQNLLFFVENHEYPDIHTLFIQQHSLVSLQQKELHRQLTELHAIVTMQNKNSIKNIFNLYQNNPMVLTNYKVPDGLSLNPLYFGIIHREMKDPTIDLEMAKDEDKKDVYVFPLWTEESGKQRIRHLNFKQPFYKEIPIKNISF